MFHLHLVPVKAGELWSVNDCWGGSKKIPEPEHEDSPFANYEMY